MNSPSYNLITENNEQNENIDISSQSPNLDFKPITETDEITSVKSELIGNFQEKCGEIYVENGNYYLICHFCNENHNNLDLFIEHIATEHLVLHNESDDTDNDSSCMSSDVEENDDLTLNKNETMLTTKDENYINNYNTINNLDMLNISSSYDDNNDYNINNELQKPEDISCEPDTGIFFHDDLSNDNFDEQQQLNNTFDISSSQLQIDPIEWNRILLTANNNGMSSDGRYYCDFCDKSYRYSKSLKEHIDIIHNKSEKQFKCTTCDKAFSKQWKLNTHLKVHTDERPFLCNLCVMSFKWKKNLQRHLIRVHSVKYSDLIYEMSRDNKNINTKNEEYINNQNNEQYPIIKNLLLTTNNQSPTLSSSATLLQTTAAPATTTTTNINSIKLETNILNSNEYFTTDNINNLYINSSSNNIINENIPINYNNIKIENNDNEQLFINKIPDFLNDQLINDNNKTTTSSTSGTILMNNDGMFSCRLCDKVYVRKDSLRSHEKIHTSGLICSICDKPFTHQYFLDRHMKTHKINNDKIFLCNVCSAILPDESSLRRHIKFHFKKTYSCRCGNVFNLRKDYRSHRKLCRTL